MESSGEGHPVQVVVVPHRSWWRSRAVQLVVPLVLLAADLVLWGFVGWTWWPWLYGLAAVAVLTLLRVRGPLGEGLTFALALIVVLVALLERAPLLAWGITGGLLVAGLAGVLLVPAVARKLPPAFPRGRVAAAIAAAGLALSVTCAIVYAVQESDRAADRAAMDAADHEDYLARALPMTPEALLGKIVEGVAEKDITDMCGHRWTFTPAAEAAFVAAHGGPDCPAVVRKLNAEIADWNTYVNDFWPAAEWFNPKDQGPRVEIDACHMEWSSIIEDVPAQPGPQLGYLVAERQYGHGYRVTEYRPCE